MFMPKFLTVKTKALTHTKLALAVAAGAGVLLVANGILFLDKKTLDSISIPSTVLTRPLPVATPPLFQNPEPTDILKQLSRLATKPRKMKASAASTPFPKTSDTDGAMHIQGTQKYGDAYVLSGSSPDGAIALARPGKPLIAIPYLDGDREKSRYRHIGGMQVVGDVLVTAMSQRNPAFPAGDATDPENAIKFWDMRTTKPTLLPAYTLAVDPNKEAQAVGAVRIGEKLIVGVVTTGTGGIWFYTHDGKRWGPPQKWVKPPSMIGYEVSGGERGKCHEDARWCYVQNINLYHQKGDPLGTIAMLTFAEGVDEKDPRIAKDRVDLFTVNLGTKTPVLKNVGHVVLDQMDKSDMRHGGGSSVSSGTYGALSLFTTESSFGVPGNSNAIYVYEDTTRQ